MSKRNGEDSKRKSKSNIVDDVPHQSSTSNNSLKRPLNNEYSKYSGRRKKLRTTINSGGKPINDVISTRSTENSNIEKSQDLNKQQKNGKIKSKTEKVDRIETITKNKKSLNIKKHNTNDISTNSIKKLQSTIKQNTASVEESKIINDNSSPLKNGSSSSGNKLPILDNSYHKKDLDNSPKEVGDTPAKTDNNVNKTNTKKLETKNIEISKEDCVLKNNKSGTVGKLEPSKNIQSIIVTELPKNIESTKEIEKRKKIKKIESNINNSVSNKDKSGTAMLESSTKVTEKKKNIESTTVTEKKENSKDDLNDKNETAILEPYNNNIESIIVVDSSNQNTDETIISELDESIPNGNDCPKTNQLFDQVSENDADNDPESSMDCSWDNPDDQCDNNILDDCINGLKQMNKSTFPALLKLFAKNQVSYEQFEALCTVKVMEFMTDRFERGNQRTELMVLAEKEQRWRKKYATLIKQTREIKAVLRLYNFQSRSSDMAKPHIVQRTVGLQAMISSRNDGTASNLRGINIFNSSVGTANTDVPIIEDITIDDANPNTNIGKEDNKTKELSHNKSPVEEINGNDDILYGRLLTSIPSTSKTPNTTPKTTPTKQVQSPSSVIKKVLSPVLLKKAVPAAVPIISSLSNADHTSSPIDLTRDDEITNGFTLDKSPMKIIHGSGPSAKQLPNCVSTQVLPTSIGYIELPQPSPGGFFVRTTTTGAKGSTQLASVSSLHTNNQSHKQSVVTNPQPFLLKNGRLVPLTLAPAPPRQVQQSTVTYSTVKLPQHGSTPVPSQQNGNGQSQPAKIQTVQSQQIGNGQSQPAKIQTVQSKQIGTGQSQPAKIQTVQSKQIGNGQSQPAKIQTVQSKQIGNGQSQPAKIQTVQSKQIGNGQSQPAKIQTVQSKQIGNGQSQPAKIQTVQSKQIENGQSQPVKLQPVPPAIPIVKQHPAPLPLCPENKSPDTWKKLPLSPEVTITKSSQAQKSLVLSWSMPQMNRLYATVNSYQIFAYHEVGGEVARTELWKKIGDVNALPLPMACSLTQFKAGETYHFAIRAVDTYHRIGPFSEPQRVYLT